MLCRQLRLLLLMMMGDAAADAVSNLFGIIIGQKQMGLQRTIDTEYQMIATSEHIYTY